MTSNSVTIPCGCRVGASPKPVALAINMCSLHAAAPDLLAALLRILEGDDGCEFKDGPDASSFGPILCPGETDPMYLTQCPWCEARTAIRKASPQAP